MILTSTSSIFYLNGKMPGSNFIHTWVTFPLPLPRKIVSSGSLKFLSHSVIFTLNAPSLEKVFSLLQIFMIVLVIWISVICGALRDLVAFVQFKNHEKHPWRSVTFSKIAGLNLKVTLLHGCFSCFLNFINGTKLCNTSYILKEVAFKTGRWS